MRISFLLGPAGTGKTFRCLSEIRSELLARPEGEPLIFLAPKQSTYQLERQLLEDGLTGYSRLHIVSFERFASFVFHRLGAAVPKFLTEQGRTMVMRALLTELQGELSIFCGAARRLGFAEEVSKQIREFRNHGLAPNAVHKIAAQIKRGHSASDKLIDLALLYERYSGWLDEKKLQDGDALLTAATELLERTDGESFRIGGIWFDGFAQLTPQELNFLLAALRFTERATLAFCVDPEARAESKISAAYLVNQTLARCRVAIEQRYSKSVVSEERLERDAIRSRFAHCPALRHLEQHWLAPAAFDTDLDGTVRVLEAADPEAEAIFVAREIVRHVRAGGRYRDVALLLRDLQNEYPHVLRRVFKRYEIPCFLDHRESVAHHPIAELTRGALRTLAFNWKHHDWFATLKCGLIRVNPEQLDELENAALEYGWSGSAWRTGFKLPKDAAREKRLNGLRERLMKPFVAFSAVLGNRPQTEELTAAIRGLWTDLFVQEQLEQWSNAKADSTLHSTVWRQMETWLDDLDLAFQGQQMALANWLPIIEAGLRNLTVGVVPPVLDQVLIGTVDRSRNPDLKILYVLGVNERIFPAAPAHDTLITDDDRTALYETGCTLGDTPAWRIAGEQFYGYIACTRPREKLILTYARTAMDGLPLNPSRFITHLQRLFPALQIDHFAPAQSLNEVAHECELTALGVTADESSYFLSTPRADESLDLEIAGKLYGDELVLSVSSLERFAACPYKFFLEQGLGVRERKEFFLDVREQGSFQHVVLAEFHEELAREGLKWRDLTPQEARARVGRIADTIIPTFKDGLLDSSVQNRFTAESYKAGLQDLIAVLIDWCRTNRFDPEVVEFGFGRGNAVPGWKIPLDARRTVVLYGRVDRVDLYRVSKTEALCVVMDYKSGLQAPNKTLLYHGVQQQLPAYLLALTRMPEVPAHFKVQKVTAAGCFLLPLSSKQSAKKSRREALDAQSSTCDGYTHEGLFDVQRLDLFDSGSPNEKSGQFKYNVTHSGAPRAKSFNALKPEDFAALLTRSEELIREFASRIYAGDIAIRPYKHGSKTACERCDYQSVCRFDPWTQPYNVLREPHAEEPS